MVVDDPTRFEPKFSKTTGRLIGWVKHKDNGEMVPLRLHQVLYIKFWNPDSPIDGLSPISAAANGIEGDLLASQFNTNFFQNSGSPAGVIEMEGNLTDEQFNRLVRQYEDRHGGTQNAHKVLILEANAKFKQSSFTQKDMDFLNQKKWNRDETLAVFNVPKMEVGVWDDINFAIASSMFPRWKSVCGMISTLR
jgi:HK97 family phage portal protein